MLQYSQETIPGYKASQLFPVVVSVSPADLSALFSVLLDPLHWHCTVVHSVYSVQVCASLGPLSRPAIASVWLGPELSPAPALPGSTVPGPPAHQEHSNLRCDFKINVKQTGGHHVFYAILQNEVRLCQKLLWK